MKFLFDLILYQPIFNLFVVLYRLIPDVGVTIFLMTVLVKLVIYPFTTASIKAQKALADLQPKLEAIKVTHKGDQQKIAQETMRLYSENKVNPLGSCLPLIIQLLITIALYYVLQAGLTSNDFSQLYSFVKSPGQINRISLGLFDLSQKGNIILPLLAGAAQFWQAKMMIRKRPPKVAGAGAKDEDMMAMMNKQMLYLMPVMTAVIGFQLPAGLAWYWLLSTVLTALQQLVIFRKQSGNTGGGPGTVVEGKIVS